MIEESRFDRLVGVDVGGTKTHLACVDTAGERRDVIRASSDWRSGHLFSDDGNLPRLAAWIGSLARLDEGTRVVVGLRDCDTDADLEVSRSALSDALGLPVQVENDADLLAPAIGAEHAIAMIVGTGSIVSARDTSGRRVTADGHGWLFGDWGSGPGLVRDAIGRLLSHSDRGGSQDDPLIHALCDHFDARDAIELASAATIRADPEVWGSAAVRVFGAADEGSLLAHDTIAAAADRLVDGVDAVLRRGGLGDRVVAAGGVIVNQPRLRDAVRDRLALRHDPLGLHTLDAAPVEGALRLAERIVAR
ncbi:BadF/BadG/BcrA/BcrD ATPase family protein [Humibacter soli]